MMWCAFAVDVSWLPGIIPKRRARGIRVLWVMSVAALSLVCWSVDLVLVVILISIVLIAASGQCTMRSTVMDR